MHYITLSSHPRGLNSARTSAPGISNSWYETRPLLSCAASTKLPTAIPKHQKPPDPCLRPSIGFEIRPANTKLLQLWPSHTCAPAQNQQKAGHVTTVYKERDVKSPERKTQSWHWHPNQWSVGCNLHYMIWVPTSELPNDTPLTRCLSLGSFACLTGFEENKTAGSRIKQLFCICSVHTLPGKKNMKLIDLASEFPPQAVPLPFLFPGHTHGSMTVQMTPPCS